MSTATCHKYSVEYCVVVFMCTKKCALDMYHAEMCLVDNIGGGGGALRVYVTRRGFVGVGNYNYFNKNTAI